MFRRLDIQPPVERLVLFLRSAGAHGDENKRLWRDKDEFNPGNDRDASLFGNTDANKAAVRPR